MVRVVIDMCTLPVPYDLNIVSKSGGGNRIFNSNYKFKSYMRDALKNAYKGSPIPLGSQVSLEFYVLFPRHIKVTSKPDLSNMLKTIEDAASGIVYDDDAQLTKELLIAKQGTSSEWKFRVVYQTWDFDETLWPSDLKD